MHELVHRMKGAALVIGARPFADACLALQRLLEQGDQGEQAPDMTELDHAYTRFSGEAIAPDTALAQHAALTQSDA